MKFLSHIKRNENNDIVFEKEITEHVSNILRIIDRCYFPGKEEFDMLIAYIVRFHDLGKYTHFFQDYLRSGDVHLKNYHFHTLIGACSFFNYLSKKDQRKALFGYFIIYHHHSNLGNITRCFPEERINQIDNRLNNQYLDLIPNLHQINKEMEIELDIDILASKSLFMLDETDDLQDEANIQNYFHINYLFSLLIEADKLDASDTPIYTRKALQSNKVDIDKGVPDQEWESGVKDFSHLKQNQLRNLVRKRVIANLENENILEQKLFTLTGPTGIGKTLTALDFALKLKQKISESENYDPQIIYALPFINIIEQSEKVYRDLFYEDDVKILTHYQYADALGQQEANKDEDGKNYNQKLMSLDTWQCDIVITTFVQFLQTLIGNRNKLLKKFNHYAGSIIILDEVQTIALKQLPLVGASLFYLSKFLDARIILMTATKPKVFELANKKILEAEHEGAFPLELLGEENDVAKVFQSFNRTKLFPLIENKILDNDDFLENYFVKHWERNLSCLVVVNTVQLSIDIFTLIRKYFELNNIENPIYYLSTNIVPAVRKELIENIKKDIINAKEGKGLKPILVSTQSVEAGVDLDFDMAFRDLGPIDSIIQIAGRVNREYDKKRIGTVFIIDFGKCGTIYGPMTEGTARNALLKFTKTKKEISETEYLDLITYYYDNIYEKNEDGFSFSTNFFNSMKELNYDGSEYSVSKYQVIESGYKTCSVYIECDEQAIEARSMFLKIVDKNCTREDFEPFKRSFHQHIIALPDYLSKLDEIKQMKWGLSENLWYVPFEMIDSFYDRVTGFIRTQPKQSIVCML